ncbi:1722_t:CDS:2, partial [Acaulospora morrowiae]
TWFHMIMETPYNTSMFTTRSFVKIAELRFQLCEEERLERIRDRSVSSRACPRKFPGVIYVTVIACGHLILFLSVSRVSYVTMVSYSKAGILNNRLLVNGMGRGIFLPSVLGSKTTKYEGVRSAATCSWFRMVVYYRHMCLADQSQPPCFFTLEIDLKMREHMFRVNVIMHLTHRKVVALRYLIVGSNINKYAGIDAEFKRDKQRDGLLDVSDLLWC